MSAFRALPNYIDFEVVDETLLFYPKIKSSVSIPKEAISICFQTILTSLAEKAGVKNVEMNNFGEKQTNFSSKTINSVTANEKEKGVDVSSKRQTPNNQIQKDVPSVTNVQFTTKSPLPPLSKPSLAGLIEATTALSEKSKEKSSNRGLSNTSILLGMSGQSQKTKPIEKPKRASPVNSVPLQLERSGFKRRRTEISIQSSREKNSLELNEHTPSNSKRAHTGVAQLLSALAASASTIDDSVVPSTSSNLRQPHRSLSITSQPVDSQSRTSMVNNHDVPMLNVQKKNLHPTQFTNPINSSLSAPTGNTIYLTNSYNQNGYDFSAPSNYLEISPTLSRLIPSSSHASSNSTMPKSVRTSPFPPSAQYLGNSTLNLSIPPHNSFFPNHNSPQSLSNIYSSYINQNSVQMQCYYAYLAGLQQNAFPMSSTSFSLNSQPPFRPYYSPSQSFYSQQTLPLLTPPTQLLRPRPVGGKKHILIKKKDESQEKVCIFV
jgi:hypothetical protein